jgi:hypothetical protein
MTRTRTLNSWWHRLQVFFAGRRDGKARIPRADEERPTDFEKSLVQQGEQALSQLRKTRAEKGARLVALQDEEMERARRVVGQFKAKYHEYDAKKRSLGRGVIVQLSWNKYLLLMGALGVSELALNVSAFQVFEKPPLLTLVMAAVVGLGLPLCAHFLGTFLKQWPTSSGPHHLDGSGPAPRSPRNVRAWRNAAYVVVTVVLAVLCLNGVAIARSQYLLGDRQFTPRDEILQQAFFYINLFVLLAATLASYFAHEEDPDFDNMRRAFLALDAQCASARSRLTRVVKELQTIQQTHEARVGEVQSVVRELVFLYRRHNRRNREDDPQAFKSDPVLPEVKDDQLKILAKEKLDQLFEEWSNVDRTPERQRPSAATA